MQAQQEQRAVSRVASVGSDVAHDVAQQPGGASVGEVIEPAQPDAASDGDDDGIERFRSGAGAQVTANGTGSYGPLREDRRGEDLLWWEREQLERLREPEELVDDVYPARVVAHDPGGDCRLVVYLIVAAGLAVIGLVVLFSSGVFG